VNLGAFKLSVGRKSIRMKCGPKEHRLQDVNEKTLYLQAELGGGGREHLKNCFKYKEGARGRRGCRGETLEQKPADVVP